ncbi:metallophosphoesterase family protein [Paenibacillus solisilvae]|uniref:Metallophosphoesterase family protein n=1 Tax=Paenibacillus solisilvae TaxID=2486751 RepID=A0ABW0W589_9BACL
MKRTIVISDIHGCITEFNDLLDLAGYQPDQDQLIVIGDYVDRGLHSKEVVERLIQLAEQHNVIALRGNHDQRLIDLVRLGNHHVIQKFLMYGGKAAIKSYLGLDCPLDEIDVQTARTAASFIAEHYEHHISWLEQLPLYAEDSRHIYVHAGLNPSYSDWKEQPDEDFMYIKERFLQQPTVADKTVVFGHTRTFEIQGSADIWFGDGKIGIDGGCAYGQQLNALEIGSDGQYRTYKISAQ